MKSPPRYIHQRYYKNAGFGFFRGFGRQATIVLESARGWKSPPIDAGMSGMDAMRSSFGISDIVTLVVAGVILGVFAVFVRDWWQSGVLVFDAQVISERLVAFGKAHF